MRYLRNVALAVVFAATWSGAASAEAGDEYHLCQQADASFKGFLFRFAEDKTFQRSRLVLPLVVRFGNVFTVDASAELWAAEKIDGMKDPLIYSRKGLKELDLVQSIVLFQPKRYAEVYQENAGEADSIRLLYHFRNIRGCWFLEEYDERGY